MNSSTWLPLKTAVTVTALVLPFATSGVETAWAAERVYDIIADQSRIAISGTINSGAGTASIQPQGAGSLTTTYSGTIRVDRGETSIQFLSGMIDAAVSGNWRPMPDGGAGTAPADYGGRACFVFCLATLDFAARDVVAELTSESLPVDTEGNFDLGSTMFDVTSGSIAYRTGGAAEEFGVASIAGERGTLSGHGSLTADIQGGVEILSIPIDTSLSIMVDSSTIDLNLNGQLVATAALPMAPPGDYNQNGAVDAADYVLWRKNLSSGTSLPNDDTPGVGPDDYTRWRANFGQTAGSVAGAESSQAAVPEPTSLAPFLLALVAVLAAPRDWVAAKNRG